ncbi:MAG: BspA family leucine-rich repeat surface protein [Niabella sp.]
MKQLFLLLSVLLPFAVDAQDFVTKWTFDAAATSITFNAQTAGTVNYTWSASPSGKRGNGSFTQKVPGSVTLSGLSIAAGDKVTLTMEPANLRVFNIDNGPDKDRLTDVSSWGVVPWTSMVAAFCGSANLNITATDVPNLSGVTDMSRMFQGCLSLNGPANINSWDVSKVTNMGDMFNTARVFNQNIGGWKVDKVKSMRGMFYNADAFNQDISSWKVDKATSMSEMFRNAKKFNQNLSSWNVSKVKTTKNMFNGAKSFDQNLGAWNLAALTTAERMFRNSGLSSENYSRILKGWAENTHTPDGVNFEGQTGRAYMTAVASFRNKLIAKNWRINDDSEAAP